MGVIPAPAPHTLRRACRNEACSGVTHGPAHDSVVERCRGRCGGHARHVGGDAGRQAPRSLGGAASPPFDSATAGPARSFCAQGQGPGRYRAFGPLRVRRQHGRALCASTDPPSWHARRSTVRFHGLVGQLRGLVATRPAHASARERSTGASYDHDRRAPRFRCHPGGSRSKAFARLAAWRDKVAAVSRRATVSASP